MPSIEWNRLWAKEFVRFSMKPRRKLYGTHWGDPDARGLPYFLQRVRHPFQIPGPLYKVVEQYVKPHVKPDRVVLEIGCGGGRWTQYLFGAKKVIAVDINGEFFEALRNRHRKENLEFYQPTACELNGVGDSSVDFVFSFGTFVHIDPDGIQQYLNEIERVLTPGGTAVIHYSDKRKMVARLYRGFSNMTGARMEKMVPIRIVEHNTSLLHHSNIIVLEKTLKL